MFASLRVLLTSYGCSVNKLNEYNAIHHNSVMRMIMVKTTVLFALMLLCATNTRANGALPSLPYTPIPSVSYAVGGLARGAHLEVKNNPSLQSETISVFESGTRNILVTGRWTEVGSLVWWEVIIEKESGITGWVNRQNLLPQAGSTERNFTLLCVGARPKWTLRVDQYHATYRYEDSELTTLLAGERMISQNKQAITVVTLRAENYNTNDDGYAIFNETGCSLPNSKLKYPFEVVVVSNFSVVNGCCSRLATPDP